MSQTELKHAIFYVLPGGRRFPVRIVSNVCGRVFSVCHIDEVSLFDTRDAASQAAEEAGIPVERVAVLDVLERVITPPDRDPAQSEMRGADSPAGAVSTRWGTRF